MPPDDRALVIVGDSVALQVSIAAQQRVAASGGPAVRYLLAWGPDDHPEIAELILDPDNTEIVASFGVWHALPPEAFNLEPGYTDPEGFKAQIRDFLEPLADPNFAKGLSLLLLDSINVEPGNEQVQLTNQLIEEVAAELDVPVRYTLPGQSPEGVPLSVTLGTTEFPVRNTADGVHFCAAAALVMANRLLHEMGVAVIPPDEADVEDVYETRPENFSRDGC